MGERPLKGYGFAPYIMYMIEKVTGHIFEYDKKHKVLKIVDDFFDLFSRESPYLIFFWISIKRKKVLYTRATKEEKVQGHNAQRRKETKN